MIKKKLTTIALASLCLATQPSNADLVSISYNKQRRNENLKSMDKAYLLRSDFGNDGQDLLDHQDYQVSLLNSIPISFPVPLDIDSRNYEHSPIEFSIFSVTEPSNTKFSLSLDQMFFGWENSEKREELERTNYELCLYEEHIKGKEIFETGTLKELVTNGSDWWKLKKNVSCGTKIGYLKFTQAVPEATTHAYLMIAGLTTMLAKRLKRTN